MSYVGAGKLMRESMGPAHTDVGAGGMLLPQIGDGE
jgi:hypothetical protein